MSKGIQRMLVLTDEQRLELMAIRDRDRRAYMRERAAAILKIAEGLSARDVALHGLHRRRDPDTVYSWLNHFQVTGVKGLEQLPRGHRGFSPRAGRGVGRDSQTGSVVPRDRAQPVATG
jgi:hypothetical protein